MRTKPAGHLVIRITPFDVLFHTESAGSLGVKAPSRQVAPAGHG